MVNFTINNRDEAIKFLCEEFKKYNNIDIEQSEKYGVKRGLRNSNGTGVLAGLTLIGDVIGYDLVDGVKTPAEGRLLYRGINVEDIIENCTKENRFGFEETIWLLLFGKLPTETQLGDFGDILAANRELPHGFREDMIFKAPSKNIMNKLARSILALYSYDYDPESNDLENIMRHSMELISRTATIIIDGYMIKRWEYEKKSMYFRQNDRNFSIAENLLSTMRPNGKFTDEEAKLLDICLILHAEHGGGNNSSFVSRVISSAGTDTYAAIAASVGSLKGSKHGGANAKVVDMVKHIMRDVDDYTDEEQLKDYLKKIINKEAGDRSGLIYGMGHAVYTKSDPRAKILSESARKLAEEKGLVHELNLLNDIERLTPIVFKEVKGNDKPMCANVDMYSGFIYRVLGIPQDLFTPLFALSRMAGWCAHRMEEVTTGGRIMRPAYKALFDETEYLDIDKR